MTTSPHRLRGFDGVRAIGILAVIVWHVANTFGFSAASLGLWRGPIMFGWAGVDLFFALSGFLITHLIQREEEAAAEAGPRTFSLRRFYVRRALRILPVFYAVFLLNSYVLAARPDVFASVRAAAVRDLHSSFGLWPYATFWGNYFSAYYSHFPGIHMARPGLAYTVYWSLCVEEHYYLVWPALLKLITGARQRLLVALALCAAAPVLRHLAATYEWEVAASSLHTVTHYRFDAILWGAIAALVFHQRIGTATRLWTAALALSGACLLVLVGTKTLSVLPPATTLGISAGLTVLALTAALTVFQVAARPDALPVRLLEWRPLRAIGKVSYGMYLVHFQAIDVVAYVFRRLPPPGTRLALVVIVVLTTIISFVTAWCLYLAIERPFLRLKERFRATARRDANTGRRRRDAPR